MTINGAFTLHSGTVYEVGVNAAGEKRQGDRQRHGESTGATLRVLAQKGTRRRTNYTIIIENDGTDAVVGKFPARSSPPRLHADGRV